MNETQKHYEIIYNYDRISKIACNHCNYENVWLNMPRTKTGHRWPFMVHDIKRHLRDEHGINLYKRMGYKIGVSIKEP